MNLEDQCLSLGLMTCGCAPCQEESLFVSWGWTSQIKNALNLRFADFWLWCGWKADDIPEKVWRVPKKPPLHSASVT